MSCQHARREYGDHCGLCGEPLTESLGQRFVAEVLHGRPVLKPAIKVTASRFPYQRPR